MPQRKIDKKPLKGKSRRISGGDTISVNSVGAGAAVAAGRGSSAKVVSKVESDTTQNWMTEVSKKIDSLTVSQDEKNDLRQQIDKLTEELQKGPNAEKNRLEKLINTLLVMSSDIFDVVVAAIQSPLAGLGMVVKKIGDKVKLEKSDK